MKRAALGARGMLGSATNNWNSFVERAEGRERVILTYLLIYLFRRAVSATMKHFCIFLALSGKRMFCSFSGLMKFCA